MPETEKIPQHRHCENCGKAFVGNGKFCCDQCRNVAEDEVKKKLRKLTIIWIVLVAVVVACIVLTL